MRKKYIPLFYFLLGFTILLSCNKCNQENKSLRKIEVGKQEVVNIQLLDFYKDLLNISAQSDTVLFSAMRQKYGSFFEQFNTGVLNIGSSKSPMYLNRLQSFTGDKDIRYIYSYTDSLFNATEKNNIVSELSDAFTRYKVIFKGKTIPRIAFQISGFNYAMVCSDSILGIGLDFYLGKSFKFYQYLQYPEYKKRVMQKDYILPHALYAWCKTEFDTSDGSSNLLHDIVNEGKLIYLIKNLYPNIQDTLLFGYTNKQLNWCIENELNIWKTLVDKKMLFNTNAVENQKFISEGPFTTGFPRESPGRLGWFVGYRIVEAYMANNTEITIEKLMKNSDANLILAKSKYKPKK